jgi:hypothetical protein
MKVGTVTFLPSVEFFLPLTPAGIRILGAADEVARELSIDMIVTCGKEGHAAPDPHCLGEAFDFKTLHLSPALVLTVHDKLRTKLGPRFYIQYEVPDDLVLRGPHGLLDGIVVRSAHATGEHFHVQRAKGTTYPPVESHS